MPDYLVRFVQIHESFRIPELRALATLQRVELEVLKYSEYVCLLNIRHLPIHILSLAVI